MITFYALLLIGFLISVGCLAARVKEGYFPLGVSIAGCAFFVPSAVSWGFIVLGLLTLGLAFRSTE